MTSEHKQDPQPTHDTPFGRIMGKWPGDETEEEIEQALKLLDAKKNLGKMPERKE